MSTHTFLIAVAVSCFIAALIISGAGHLAEVIHYGQNATYAY